MSLFPKLRTENILLLLSYSIVYRYLFSIEDVSVCDEVFHEACEYMLSIEGEALAREELGFKIS